MTKHVLFNPFDSPCANWNIFRIKKLGDMVAELLLLLFTYCHATITCNIEQVA